MELATAESCGKSNESINLQAEITLCNGVHPPKGNDDSCKSNIGVHTKKTTQENNCSSISSNFEELLIKDEDPSCLEIESCNTDDNQLSDSPSLNAINNIDSQFKSEEITLTTTEHENCSVSSSKNDADDPTKVHEGDVGIVSANCGICYARYKDESQMPAIMHLITKDLSEPYSIYTYRYFIHNWPHLCYLVSLQFLFMF